MNLARWAVVAFLSAGPGCHGVDRAGEKPPAPSVAPELAPGELALAELAAREELERWTRERDERLVEAIDPGEAAEHARAVRQDAIDAGRVPIKDLFRQGEAIFDRAFTVAEGLGSGRNGRAPPGLSRVEGTAAVGGPDAISCRECHGRGGDDGHGELHQRAWLDGDGRHFGSAHPRLAPHLAGLGAVQRLAEEMSADLRAELEMGRSVARVAPDGNYRLALKSKGVSFGEVVVHADGSVDDSGLRGVDADLVVKPFGWKGTEPTLRSFARQALAQHLGLEPPAAAPASPLRRTPPGDGDRDGVADELEEGQLTSLVVYLALLDTPLLLPPRDPESALAWRRGEARFRSLGCAECHRPELPLSSLVIEERASPHGPALTIDLARDNQVPPRLEQFDYARPVGVRLFSDLRRHDLGPSLAEAGGAASQFLTRPLWGLGDRGPYYLHDGRARSLREAILAHRGEASTSSQAFAALPAYEARTVEVFLRSLRRAPQARIAP